MTAMTAEKTPVTQETSGLEEILPEGQKLVLAGIHCDVRHLKMREFFEMLGILTNGLGGAIQHLKLDGANAEELGATLGVAFVMALPNQGEEFLTFVKHVVVPVSGDPGEQQQLVEYLDNPEMEDMLPIIDAVIENEQDNLYDLLGKARAYLAKWTKTFQAKKTVKT